MSPKGKAKGKAAPKAAPIKKEPEEGEPEAKGKKYAEEGKGNDPGKISTMLGLLKYRAGPAKADEAEKEDARQALDCYRALSDPKDRAKFLADFEKNGGGKGPGSLKFHVQFHQRLTHAKSKEVTSTEDFYTRPFGVKTNRLLSRRRDHKIDDQTLDDRKPR